LRLRVECTICNLQISLGANPRRIGPIQRGFAPSFVNVDRFVRVAR
jgi:hypothetical protein